MDWKLTEAEQALVEKWFRYAMKIANSYYQRYSTDYDETVSYAAYVLVRIVHGFSDRDRSQENLIKFTLARDITSNLNQYFHAKFRKQKWALLDANHPVVYLDENQIEFRMVMEKAKQILKPKEYQILELWVEGYGDREIGRIVGVSNVHAQRLRCAAISTLQAAYGCGPCVSGMGAAQTPT